MSQNAGTVYAEIRVALDKLQGDITKVNGLFQTIPGTVQPAAQKTTNAVQRMQTNITSGFERMAKTGIGKMAMMAQGMQKAIMAAPIIGAVMMIVGLLAKLGKMVNDFLTAGVEVYQAHQQELAKMNSVLNATGAAAWTSIRQMDEAAERLASTTRFARDEILSMQTQLLTFRAVTGAVFHEATEAITNMATAMGKDLGTATGYVGRALDNPIYGMRTLTRQGVIFTDTQRNMIEAMVEAGDIASAQRIIIDELGNTFGNAAREVAEITAAQDRLNNAEEALERARGRRNAARVNRRANRRAARLERRAERIETANEIRDVNRRIEEGYTAQIEELERLRDKLEDTTDLWSRVKLEDRIAKFELETNLMQVSDQLTLADRNLRYFEMNWGRTHPFTVAARERVNALNEQREAILESIAAQDKQSANNMRDFQQEEMELLRIEELNQQLLDVEQARVNVLYEIDRAFQSGLITQEQAIQRRISAYNQEGEAVIRLTSLMRNMNFTTDAAAGAFDAFRATVDNALASSVASVNEAQEALVNYGEDFSTAWARNIAPIRQTLATTIFTINSQLNANIITMEEHAERVVQANATALTSLENLAERMGLAWDQSPNTRRWRDELAGIVGDFRDQQEAARLAEEALERYNAANESLAETLQGLTLQYLQLGGTIEGVYETAQEMEERLAMERITNSEEWLELLEQNNGELTKIQQNILQIFSNVRAREAGRELNDMLATYRDRIESLSMTSGQAIRRQRDLAIATAETFREIDNALTDELIASIEKYYAAIARRDAWQQAVMFAQQAIGTMNAMFGLASALIQRRTQAEIQSLTEARDFDMQQMQTRHDFAIQLMRMEHEEEQRLFDERYRMLQEDLQRRMRATLFAAGLIRAVTEADAEAELEMAKATMDQRAILQAQNNLNRIRIEQEYAAKEKELEEQRAAEQYELEQRRAQEQSNLEQKQLAEREARDLEFKKRRAQLEYRAALASWNMQMTNAIASGALAIAQAAINMWPVPAIPMVALATATTAAQIATVGVNRPRLPAFQSGGIVPGSSFNGDNMLIRANSKERVMTAPTDAELLEFFKNFNERGMTNQPVYVTVISQLDGRVISEVVAETMNNGMVTIIGDRAIR